jgi:predicted ATPase
VTTSYRTWSDRLNVFVSSDADEMATERAAACAAIENLRLHPVALELDAPGHPSAHATDVAQSDIFIGIYGERYGAPRAPGSTSDIELQFVSAAQTPKLVYLKDPAEAREPQLAAMIDRISEAGSVSYKRFATPEELQELIENDLAILLSEGFEADVEPVSDPPEWPPLPVETTALVGREREIQELTELLHSEGVRLVTIIGEGGIGKSRVAVAVARRFAQEMKVGFVALSALSSSSLVVATIAQSLNLKATEDDDLEDVLIARLRTERVLLVLDNFEQVLGAATDLARLLQGAPNLQVVVTSRAALRLRGECEWTLSPLAVPDETSSGDLADYAAVTLFVDRARSVRPAFEPDEEELTAIAEVCRRLDGLPLAIELAAARIRILSPGDLLGRLRDRFAVLGHGSRDLPARQRTLHAAIDWSYQLLEEDEKTVFARLSVFVAGRTLRATEEVCDPEGALDVLGCITSLVEKSLLRRADGAAGKSRFTMLESVHDFALEELRARGELEIFRSRHAHYFLAFSEMAVPRLRGSQGQRWLRRLAEEQDNIRAALAWANENEPELLVKFVATLPHFWMVHGDLAEAMEWTGRALEEQHTEMSQRIDIVLHRGEIAWGLGQRERAMQLYEEARRLAGELGDEECLDLALRGAGRIAMDLGEHARARDIYERSLELRRKKDWTQGIAETLNNLGLVESLSGDDAAAVPLLEECRALFERLEDQQGVARAALNLAVSLQALGRLEEAEEQGKEGLRLWHALDGRWDVADCLEVLAAIAIDRGRSRDGLVLIGAAERLRSEIGAARAPFDEARVDAALRRARLALPEAAERALEAGRGMGLEEAVAQVLT